MSLGFFGDTCLKIFLEQVVGLLHIPLLRMKVFALLWHESELPCSPRMALLLQFALCLLQPFVVLLVGHVFFWVWILGAVREAWSVGPMSCRHVGKQIFPSLGCLHCVSWSWQDWTCPIGASFHGYCCWHNCSAAPSYCLDIQCFSVLERRLPWLEQEGSGWWLSCAIHHVGFCTPFHDVIAKTGKYFPMMQQYFSVYHKGSLLKCWWKAGDLQDSSSIFVPVSDCWEGPKSLTVFECPAWSLLNLEDEFRCWYHLNSGMSTL